MKYFKAGAVNDPNRCRRWKSRREKQFARRAEGREGAIMNDDEVN